MKKTYTLLSILVFSLTSIFAQKNVEFEIQNFETKADYDTARYYYYSGDDYYEDGVEWYGLAIKDYLKANKLNPNNAILNYKIGTCYDNMNNSFLALKYYNKAYKLNPNVNPVVLYKIAQGYQYRLQLKKAESTYNQFISEYKKSDKKDWEDFVKKRIKECHTANKLLKNFVGGMVVNLKGVNSKFDDHSPLVTLDENTMYFTSRRLKGNHGNVDAQGQAFEDIYVARKSKNGVWQKPKNLGDIINTKNHDATIGLFPNEDRLYIYKGKLNKGDIWITKKTKEGWTEPEALPAPINSKYQETAISFSPNGKTVYFVTNRPNGVGKKDIWKAEVKEDGTFVNAHALDTTINTPEDERSVFLQQDGKTMYFSSKGHEGMGGFDIFRSTLDSNGKWGKPVNMGYPINTMDNDVCFITSKNGERGYFSSVKMNGLGGQDVYMYVFPEKEDKTLANVKGNITDAESLKPILAHIVVTDIKTKKVIADVNTDSRSGAFKLKLPKNKDLNIAIHAENYAFLSQTINLKKDEQKNFSLTLNTENSICKAIVLENVWFDFDKANLKEISFAELNQLVDYLNKCNQYNVEIGGHTCDMGSKAYNDALSLRRAQSIVNYLIKKGVDKKRLVVKGYGFSKPLVPNTSKTNRIKNRRVEFKLIQL